MDREEAHHSVEHHLVSLPVLDLVVQVLGQIQALVNVLLKPDSALQGTTRWGVGGDGEKVHEAKRRLAVSVTPCRASPWPST